ncbi:MAG: hypothetical protein ABIH74_01335 [Candidatus Omnitrophota bacterium]
MHMYMHCETCPKYLKCEEKNRFKGEVPYDDYHENDNMNDEDYRDNPCEAY